MAIVRATCPDCGDVEICTDDVKVRVCVDTSAASYAFRCPSCSAPVAKPAEAGIVHLLVSSGSPLTMWRLPAELAEPHRGPAITHDDVLVLHQILETKDWFARVAAMVRS
ncbi:MAG TPA: hypothetical protein VK975_01260 [Acidimicrobiales bacterium]|nr:hypothetical protein [Acidimicrobiales bacterium]